MSSVRWDAEIAEVYDETYAAMFEPTVLRPMADVLANSQAAAPPWSSRWAAGGCSPAAQRAGDPGAGHRVVPGHGGAAGGQAGRERHTGDHRRHDDRPGARDLRTCAI